MIRHTNMTNTDPTVTAVSPVTAAWPTVPTWRYLGNRDAADVAYCARFGTTEAPEPSMAPGGMWAYTLPASETRR